MSTNREEQINMLAKFFNAQAGTCFRFGTEVNKAAISGAIDRADGDVKKLMEHVKIWLDTDGEKDLVACFSAYRADKPIVTVEEVKETEPVIPTKSAGEVSEAVAMTVLSNAVLKIIQETKQEAIEERILASCEDKVREFIKNEYGTIERKCITVVDGKPVNLDGVQHEKFEQVLQFVANNEPVFLTGAAGCGKNVICQQVAKALGLDFYFSNAVTQEYKITGFTDAMGVFHESQFYKAFKNGGLFMLDEMDASIPEVLVILNAAIANRYFDFPAPIGYVEAHPDFRVVAAGNTFGLGANYEYVGRNQLDMASLDRFAMIQVGYDNNIEMSVANGNVELVNFCDDFRRAAERGGVRVIVSYRAISRIAKLEGLLGTKEALKTCLVKSLETDDINAIMSNMERKSGKYYDELKRLAK